MLEKIAWARFFTVERIKNKVLCKKLLRSGLFDTAWYLRSYSDVASANVDPLTHYLKYGWKEERDPSTYFSTKAYLQKYPSLKKSDICPLIHYLNSNDATCESARNNKGTMSFVSYLQQVLSNSFSHKEHGIDATEKEDVENPNSETWAFIKKKYLSVQPKEIDIEDLDKNCFGRLRIGVGITHFETCMIPSMSKKLYVFLTAAGNGNNYPTFHRISWAIRFDGICLYIDDPTRNEHSFNGGAFYFGDKEHNYLEYVLMLVRKVQNIHEIKSEDITFISSSNGAFASLYIANKLLGCRCIALNPRIDIVARFKKQFDLSDVDVTMMRDRLDVRNFLQNKKTKFFLYFNNENEIDYWHCKQLIKAFGKPVMNGLTHLSKNITLLVVNIGAVDPHLVQPNWNFVKFIESIMGKKLTKTDEEACYKLVDNMRKSAQIDIIKHSLSESFSGVKNNN